MMRLLHGLAIALAAILFVPVASAQTTFTAPDCIHKSIWTPFGTGTDWKRDTIPAATATGATISWWGWWCPAADGSWKPYVFRCVEGRTCLDAVTLTKELDTAARSSDRLGALRTVIEKYQSQPLPSEANDWYFAGAAALQELQAIKPDQLRAKGRK